MALVAVAAVRTRRMTGADRASSAPAVASGPLGEVREPLEPLGSVYIAGEEWTARTADDRPLARGTPCASSRSTG